VDDIVDQLRNLASALERNQGRSTVVAAADEIERLRAEVRSQALELLVAHSEALDLYDLTTPTEQEAT
jgi:HAMP domain-containing protein